MKKIEALAYILMGCVLGASMMLALIFPKVESITTAARAAERSHCGEAEIK